MSCAEIIKRLISSDNIIFPYDLIRGVKNVSSIILLRDKIYEAFYFIDYPTFYSGPKAIEESSSKSDEIKVLIEREGFVYESLVPQGARIRQAAFLMEGEPVVVIDELEFTGKNGRAIRLLRDGATYPNTFLIISDSV
ncbi:MAG: hypothetical protein JOZ58_05505 [Acetobacteraceae bacterium]|nr:hypothetical protein [Acetobacteraceae bacterium]